MDSISKGFTYISSLVGSQHIKTRAHLDCVDDPLLKINDFSFFKKQSRDADRISILGHFGHELQKMSIIWVQITIERRLKAHWKHVDGNNQDTHEFTMFFKIMRSGKEIPCSGKNTKSSILQLLLHLRLHYFTIGTKK